MKFIVALSSLALVSLSSVAPCLAVNQSVGRSSNQSLSSQALPSAAKSFQVAGFWGPANQIINIVEREEKRAAQRADREKRAQERRERAEKAAIERKQRAEAYQQQQKERIVAEEARRAAEKARFDSLTPQQKKEYLARKRAQQEAMWRTLEEFGATVMGSGSSQAPSERDQIQEWRDQQRLNERMRLPESQPAPAPVQPIGPIYGNGPGGSFYGN